MAFQDSSGDLIADRRYALAQDYYLDKDYGTAADLLEQARELAPGWPPLHFRLGECYMALERRDESLRAFRAYLDLDPADTMGAVIKLALLGAAPAPATLPAGYIATLFDDYAPRFDKALVERLSYTTPEKIAAAVKNIHPMTGNSLRILDLGCGTGLSGAVFVSHAAWLEGIDLSAGMMAQAQSKGFYHRLTQGNILEDDLVLSPPYDLVIAADVLVYVGALEKLFTKIKNVMMPSGLFAFSVQKLDGEHSFYCLGADHRYAHSRTYIESSARQSGLGLISLEEAVLRQDGGTAINGYIVVLGSPSK